MRKSALPAIALFVFPFAAYCQPAGWNDPFPPHRVMDNVYYVGTKELASFLIVTPEGLVLMNSDYETSVPVIEARVRQLGFDFKNIKILIAGHAHPDHVEEDALVNQLTGAQVVVGRVDAPKTKEFRPGGKGHPIDRLVDDGDTVALVGTKGCFAWTTDLKENGKTYHAFIECSLNSSSYRCSTLGMIDDFIAAYKKARTFPVDVFLSSHASFYHMAEKYEKLKARREGDPNPFVDPEGYKAHVDEYEKSFEAAVAKQQAQPAGNGK
jgi:metallo-beta-lactamase class B